MTLSEALKTLANGINPETGEVLPADSAVNRPDAIRLLFALAEEVQASSVVQPVKSSSPQASVVVSSASKNEHGSITAGQPAKFSHPYEMVSFRDLPGPVSKHNEAKSKITLEQRRQKNIAEGKPPKSHFPWTEDELSEMATSYRQGIRLSALTQIYERSELAIASQLAKMSLMTPDEYEECRQEILQKSHAAAD